MFLLSPTFDVSLSFLFAAHVHCNMVSSLHDVFLHVSFLLSMNVIVVFWHVHLV